MKEPIVYLLKILLRENNIRVNEEELEFQILSHPSYPSLHAITGVLDHFAIKNYALEVPENIETLDLLPLSFLAFIKGDEDNGLALITKHGLSFELSFGSSKKKIFSIDDFLEVWTGVIVIIENDKPDAVPEINRINITKIFLYLTLVAVFAMLILYRVNLFQAIHFLLSLVGVAISVLIVQHELGLHSKALDKFCSEKYKKTSCNAVLNSKGATLFGPFKFSDVGIVYFVSLVLSWALLIIGNTSYNFIILITVFAIPFTFFSVYYQFRIVKKWCLLCLSVVSVLWLQVASLYFINVKNNVFSFDLKSAVLTAFGFLTTLALWLFIAPKLKKEQELNVLKIEHYKFKRSYDIFKSLIFRTERINTDIYDGNEIIFCGNNGSSLLNIVVITNPLCGFCKEAHELVENILRRKDGNVQVNIRFIVNDDINSIDTKTALKLIEIYHKDGAQICLEAMHDIYGKLSPDDWLLKWGEPGEPRYIDTLAKEKIWCRQNNINFTPEILVNGRSFPKEYNKTDLLYFVEDIIEEETEIANLQTSELETMAEIIQST